MSASWRSQTTTSQYDYMEEIRHTERRISIPLKWLLFVYGVVILWRLQQPQTPTAAIVAFALYGAATVLLTAYFYSRRRLSAPVVRVALMLSLLSDSLFASLLIYFTGGLGSELYLLYCLLAIKAIIYCPLWIWILVGVYLCGPLYVLALYYRSSSLYFLSDRQFMVRYALLFLTAMLTTYLGWIKQSQQAALVRLGLNLAHSQQNLDGQTSLMKATAQDLGNRLIELRSLQEGIKAINSALALEAVLRHIVANASQVLGGSRCSIALLDPRTRLVTTLAASGISPEALWGTQFPLGQGIAGWVVDMGQPALIGEVGRDPRFVTLGREPINSIMCVPLISDDEPIGALSATSPHRNAFDTEDLGRLEAFADQAAVAVKNSRLYHSLFEKSTELEAILRGIGDGVLVTDPDLRLLMMNPAAAHMFHLPQVPTNSEDVTALVHNESLESMLREALESQDSIALREIEVASVQGPKREMIYQGLASAIPAADGQVRGIVVVLRDITSQRELELMKSNFLSVVSHELRTPLHSIKGFVDIILMGKTGEVNELQRDFLETVKQQTTQLQAMINDLLEFSRLESGQIHLRISDTSMNTIATRVVDKLLPLADEGQIDLSENLPIGLDLEADEVRVEQVLTNLVGNAIKFTPPDGSILIRGADLGEEIQVSVRDTVIGIPKDEQDRIFDRFYQVDSGSTRSYKGTGLGLTISKHIVEHHRGRIWVDSVEGEGSVFSFVLPKHQTEDEEMELDFTRLPSERR
jgi:signal transduction histidine kinase